MLQLTQLVVKHMIKCTTWRVTLKMLRLWRLHQKWLGIQMQCKHTKNEKKPTRPETSLENSWKIACASHSRVLVKKWVANDQADLTCLHVKYDWLIFENLPKLCRYLNPTFLLSTSTNIEPRIMQNKRVQHCAVILRCTTIQKYKGFCNHLFSLQDGFLDLFDVIHKLVLNPARNYTQLIALHEWLIEAGSTEPSQSSSTQASTSAPLGSYHES